MDELNGIDILIKTLKDVADYDFSEYSIKSFTRRIEKILTDNNLTINQLVEKIKNADKEYIESIIQEITVNTTEFFRTPAVWHSVRYRILPKFKNADRINIWHAACSTGQEVYSMAMLLNEMNLLEKSHIYASDINSQALEKAKKGLYSYRLNVNYLQNFDEVLRKNPYNFEEYINVPYSKYFDIDTLKDKMKVKDFLKKNITFKKLDLVKRKNIFHKKFDIIMCRNVLIYFNIPLQNKTIDFFYENLNFPGYLILGENEDIWGNVAIKFHKKHLFYTKKLI